MKQSYLIKIQFLGYRYHGWMKQPKVKTVQEMFEKTIAFIYQGSRFKTFGTSRTDAKVSANQFGVYLTIDQTIDENTFLPLFNQNLPNDIKALSIQSIHHSFDPLTSTSRKHYTYLFAHGIKPHPFSAALIHTELDTLDINLMSDGAKRFEGTYNFKKYVTKPSPNTSYIRTISRCEITPNDQYTANFFPKDTFALHVVSAGFMRYQIRLMMGQLLALGRGEISLTDIDQSLNPTDEKPLRHIAPGSGLILQDALINID